MLNAIYNYSFTSKHRLFFDTNIWLFLYGPNRPIMNKEVSIYSKSFQKILEAKSKIYIDVLTVSEFVNTCARTEFYIQKSGDTRQSFKKFRQSGSFKPVAKTIANLLKKILNNCERIESNFSRLNIETLINKYAKGNSDINDQVIESICKQKRLSLVTHDQDFRHRKVHILTANKNMLK